MRQFKLKEVYPHPTYRLMIGMVIIEQGSVYTYYNTNLDFNKQENLTFGQEIENYPEFWEEVIDLPLLYTSKDMEAAYKQGVHKASMQSDWFNFEDWIIEYNKKNRID